MKNIIAVDPPFPGVRCSVCSQEFTSRYFLEVVSKSCAHLNQVCFPCLMKHIRKHRSCPTCKQGIDQTFVSALEREAATLDRVSPKITPRRSADGAAMGVFHVKMLDGKTFDVSNMTSDQYVLDFQHALQRQCGVEPSKQRLVIAGRDIKPFMDGRRTTLSSFGITPGCTLHLLVLMYAVNGGNINNLSLNLSWGYPPRGKDFLDASCLVYSETTFLGLLDYNHRTCSTVPGIVHSGDMMNDSIRRGTHTIDVSLDQLPSSATHLLFTLSAWNEPTVATFGTPQVALRDTANKNDVLSTYTITSRTHTQAIIMCAVVRTGGGWNVVAAGTQCSGNAANYNPIQSKITELILGGVFMR